MQSERGRSVGFAKGDPVAQHPSIFGIAAQLQATRALFAALRSVFATEPIKQFLVACREPVDLSDIKRELWENPGIAFGGNPNRLCGWHVRRAQLRNFHGAYFDPRRKGAKENSASPLTGAGL